MENITIAQFDALGDRYLELDNEIKRLELEMKPLAEEQSALKNKIMKIMEEQKKTSYSFRGFNVVLKQNASVTTPKEKEQKLAFLDYVEKKYGDFVRWDYVSINSQKLNSFYRTEREDAALRKDMDFEIPGIGKESIYYTLSVTRK